MPCFAIVYGALFLSEPVTTAMLAGLALILVGVALGSGRVVRPRAAEPRRGDPLNVDIRRSQPDDLDFLVELVAHEDVEPFLAAARPHDRDSARRPTRAVGRRSRSSSACS